MTDQQRAAILKALKEQTEAHEASPLEARAFMLRSGVYTPEGELTPEYGGPEQDERCRPA